MLNRFLKKILNQTAGLPVSFKVPSVVLALIEHNISKMKNIGLKKQ